MHELQRQVFGAGVQAVSLLRRLPWTRIGLASAAFSGALVLAYSVGFFWPRSVQFAYATSSCFTSPTLLPGLVKPEASQHYDVTLPTSLSIGNVPLFANQVCLTPREAPQPNASEAVYLAPLGLGLKKQITVQTPELPKASVVANIEAPVSIKDAFIFKLDQADDLFTYRLSGNRLSTTCDKTADSTLSCSLVALELIQAKSYKLMLERLFNEQPVETLLTTTITTVEPVEITKTSIAANETIYGIPTTMTLNFNKPVTAYDGVELKQLEDRLPITHKLLDPTTLEITFTKPLPRNAQLHVIVAKASAEDKGYLSKPYMVYFSTSGGPKVAGINIGHSKVSTGASIVLTFDSNLAAGQNLQHFIRAERDAGQMEASYVLSGRTVTVTPRGGMPRCTAFTIRVLEGLGNDAGISGGQGTWVYNSRTVCQSTFSIGSSVNGRGITGYKFGSGSERIVFVGGIHGNERSAVYIMQSLIDYLEANPGVIPDHRTVIIIPNVNPDGYAVNTRMNARSVDLNRNFPTSNWQSAVTEPNGQYYEHGGGTSPLSEPEASALANYITAQNPKLVMSYHAAAKIVSANEVGNSMSLAHVYGPKASYPVYGNDTGGTFDYAITGAFEDWLRERGTPCILIELINKSSNEFSRHRSAILAMIQH